MRFLNKIFVESRTKTDGYGQKKLDREEEDISEKVSEYQTGIHIYISSDEEGVDGFLSHSYSWESDTWKHVKKPRYQVSRDMSTKE